MTPRCRYCEGRLAAGELRAHRACEALWDARGWNGLIEAMEAKGVS